ncbi:MAG: rhomboid family intramembrane serine protease [Lachnospiraceae bacterium]|nr:rhomboid family intramembrane serine protease [Lachnospiraceae bacterium]
MDQQLGDLFRGAGYKKLHTEAAAVSAYFLAETGYVNVVMLYDADLIEGADASYYREQAQRITWRFHDAGQAEVHLLTLLLTSDLQKGRELVKDDSHAWIIDKRQRALEIPPDAPENFYGIRGGIEMVLSRPETVNSYPETPLEYDANGRRCIRSINQRPLVNHGLLILNLMGYALCILFVSAMYEWGDLRYIRVRDFGEWYRIFTSMFLHADVQHLAGNMMMLLFLGDILERALGHIRYFLLYMAGGVLSAFVSMYAAFLTNDPIGSVGASGAIFAVCGGILWVLLRNHGKLEMLTTKKTLFLIAYSLYFGFTSKNVDNAAHVGGAVAGFLLAILLYHKKRSGKNKREGEGIGS